MIKVGFIGTGNMGGALATAASKSSEVSLLLSNKPESVAVSLSEKIGGSVTDNVTVVKEADYIFLGIKPQILTEVIEEIKSPLKDRGKDVVIVSMLAGKYISQIEDLLLSPCPIIRIMPNLACSVGEGMILYTKNPLVDDAKVETFLSFMKEAGRFSMLSEKLFPAATGISGCGPAFAAMFIEALADGGVANGLTRNEAYIYAAQMLKGTSEYILESGIHPGALKDMVCSPGGTTIAGVETLEEYSFRSALISAVTATVDKDKELSGC